MCDVLVIIGPNARQCPRGRSARSGAIVSTTVGDRQDWDNCIVSGATRASRTESSGSSTGDDMLVNLNCDSRHSTANSPGYSAASPEGRASQAAEQQQAAQAQAELDELAAADAQQGDE
jgi:hypothetical protein